MAYSHDGKYIATAAADNNAIIWDARTSKSLFLLKGHVADINSLDFSPDGNYLVTGSSDKTAAIWNIHTGEQLYSLPAQDNDVVIVQFSPGSKQILVGCADGKSFLWSVDKKIVVYVLQEKKVARTGAFPLLEPTSIKTAEFSADGNYVLIHSLEDILSVYNITSGKKIYSCQTAAANFLFPAERMAGFSPDAEKVLALTDMGYRLVNLKDTSEKITLENKSDPSFINFKISSSGDSLIAINNSGTIFKWNLHTGKLISVLKHQGLFVYYYKAAFNFDNNSVLTAVSDSSIKSLDINTGELRYQVKTGSVLKILLSPANDFFAVNELWEDVTTRKIATGNKTGSLGTHVNFINNTVADIKNDHILSASYDKAIRIWSLSTGRMLKVIPGIDNSDCKVQLSNGGNYFYTYYSNIVKIFNAADGSLKYKLGGGPAFNEKKATLDIITSIEISPDEKYIAASSADHSIKIWDMKTGQRHSTLTQGDWGFIKAGFSPDSKYIAGVTSLGQITIWNLANKNIVDSFKTKALGGNFFLSNTANLLCFENLKGNIIVYDINKRKIISTIILANKNDFIAAAFSNDNKLLLVSGQFISTVWNISKATKTITINQDSYSILTAKFNGDDKGVLIVTSDGMIHFYHLETGQEDGFLLVDVNAITDINGPYGDYFLASSPASIYLYRPADNQGVMLTPIDRTGYIITTDTGWYTSTPDAIQWLSWKINDKVFDFDQWDIQYNRPDKVLEMLGNKDTALQAAYRSAYEKRVRKIKLDTLALRNDYHMPETEIVNSKEIEGLSKEAVIKLKTHCFETDKTNTLTKFFISINGNPLYGQNGLSPRSQNITDTVYEIPVTLSRGLNAIKISCMNNRAAESLRQSVYITYEPLAPVGPKTYFIGIGVSNYKDSSYNLRYAAKDVKDFSTVLKDKYPETSITLLTNEQVTTTNISSLKKMLLQTNPDDRIIVSLSGHGIIDRNYDFYFGTWDIDFKNPAAKGLSYAALEWLLDSIPARNKLVLMDACHSGELDKEGNYVTSINPADGNVKEVKGLIVASADRTGIGLKNTFELMQGLFANIGKGNGATIISAAAGTEFAYEGNGRANGVFTYCVLQGLKNNEADQDKDGVITVKELQQYVSEQVEKLTRGMQKPTSRQTNFDNDWDIWKL